MGDWNFPQAQPVLHHPPRHTQVKTRAIGSTCRRPGMPRVDQSRVSGVEHDASAVLHVAPIARKLGDHDTGAVLRAYRFRGPLPEGERAGRESREGKAPDVANLDCSSKGSLGELDAAVAADLLCIPLPSVKTV